MIPYSAIREFFPDAAPIKNGVLKFTLKVPALTVTYYLKQYIEIEADLLLAIEGDSDDAFAVSVFSSVFDRSSRLVPPAKVPLTFSNPYGFEAVFVGGPAYHGHLKGALDQYRTSLFICVPAYDCEFSGTESSEEFLYTWIYILPHTLSRTKCPKIKISYANPKTRSGTKGLSLTRSAITLKTAIEALEAVPGADVRVTNFLDKELKLTSDRANLYRLEIGEEVILRDKTSTFEAVDTFLCGKLPLM